MRTWIGRWETVAITMTNFDGESSRQDQIVVTTRRYGDLGRKPGQVLKCPNLTHIIWKILYSFISIFHVKENQPFLIIVIM